MTDTCNCRRCRPDNAPSEKNLQQTTNLVRKVDSKINTHLATFRAYGCHSGPCASQNGQCCWHFSEYYCHYVGHSSIVAWLETCAEENLSFSMILQDFAFFSVFINDLGLAANLARGIALYMVEFAKQVYDAQNKKFLFEEMKVDDESLCTMQPFKIDTLSVFAKCGWLTRPFLEPSAAVKSCMDILKTNRGRVRLILANEARQKPRQLPFELIVRALVAAFCTSKDSPLGLFFIDFYGEVLPLATFTSFASSVKPVVKLLYGKLVCKRMMSKFLDHRCLKLLDGELRNRFVQSCSIQTTSKRSDIDAERVTVNLFVEHCRFILLDFFFNYIFFSSKLLLYLHLNPSSLAFLNAFRIFLMTKSEKLLTNFAFENLLNYNSVSDRANGDPVISVAPHCFNCGAFIDKVWPQDEQFKLLDKVVARESSLRCECAMARYCSQSCATCHSGAHADFCIDRNYSSVRSQ